MKYNQINKFNTKDAIRSTFRYFFKQNVVPGLKVFEKERLKIVNNGILGFVFITVVCIGAIFRPQAPEYEYSDLNAKIIAFLSICIFSYLLFLTTFLWWWENIRNSLKARILSKVISYLGDFHLGSDYVNYTKVAMLQRRLIWRDDLFSGTYKGIEVQIEEICGFLSLSEVSIILDKETIKNLKKMPNCIILSFKDMKETNAVVVVRNRDFPGIINYGQNVKLEDVEFEKIYETSANEQIEARYVLTTSLMERLKALNDMGIKAACCFQRGKVYIAIKTDKNMFEISLFKSVYDINQYKIILDDLREVLKIIDVLKLDNNIGL